MRIKENLFKPQNIFFIFCLIYGSIFLFLNPPFQAPDEDAHLFKMYGFTIGSLNMKKENNRSGQILPENLISIYKYYDAMKLNNNMKTSLRELDLTSEIKLEKEKTVFLQYTPAWYTPVSYFPSFIVLWILKLLNVKPLCMIYILRFCSLFTYLALMYGAISITPVKKWLFTTIALLPLCIYQAGAISTDALTFGLGFLLIAYTLKLTLDENNKNINTKQICLWGVLFVYLCFCKYAYFPLGLLYFILPKEKFESSKVYYNGFFVINLINLFLISVFLGANFWASKGVITEITQKTLPQNVLIKYILTHPFDYLGTVIGTTKTLFSPILQNMISSFGWSFAMVPKFVSNLYYVLILAAIFYEDKKETAMLTLKNKGFAVAGILLSYLVIITSVFLLYQEYPIIYGVQGRYLTILLLLGGLVLSFKKLQTNYKVIPILIVVFSNLLMLVSILTLISRFY